MRLDPNHAASLLDRLYRTAILITQGPARGRGPRPGHLPKDSSCAARATSGPGSELHYLRAAMRRRHVDRHRESTRRVAQVELDSAPVLRGRPGEEPCARAEQAEVIDAIRALPAIHRDVLVATYVAGLHLLRGGQRPPASSAAR